MNKLRMIESRFCPLRLRLSNRTRGCFLTIAAFGLFIAAVAACASAVYSSAESTQMNISITTIHKGNFSGIVEPLDAVIRTPTEWENLWKRHVAIQSPPSPIPSVDFSKDIVVAVFLGQKSTGGYEVTITTAERNAAALRILYAVKSATGGGAAIQSLTQPFHIVRIARADGPVQFSRTL